MAAALPAGDPFDALGDPNRRAIVELLGAGERSVQEIADVLPISRPAVSRHLRLLKRAGLVVEKPQGTRRIYQLHDQGMEAVRAYLERVWGESAARFRLVAANTGDRTNRHVIEPIRLTFEVECPVDHAFEVWTRGSPSGGPRDHTVSAEDDLAGRPRGSPGWSDLRTASLRRRARLG